MSIILFSNTPSFKIIRFFFLKLRKICSLQNRLQRRRTSIILRRRHHVRFRLFGSFQKRLFRTSKRRNRPYSCYRVRLLSTCLHLFTQGINEEIVIYAEAVWDHVAIESEELPFSAGDVIEVYNVLDREWWWGMCNGRSGWFPSDFVRVSVPGSLYSDSV